MSNASAESILGIGGQNPDVEAFDKPQRIITVPKTKIIRPDLRGKLVEVIAGSTPIQPMAGLSTPEEPEEQDWSITLQMTRAPQYQGIPIGGTMQGLFALIVYGVGQATFQKEILLTGAIQRLTIHARQVQIFFYSRGSAYRSQVNGIDVLPQVNCSCSPGKSIGPDFYTWSWGLQQAGADNAPILKLVGLTPTTGVIGVFSCSLTTAQAPGTALYPMLFDTNIAPVSGTSVPIVGTSLGAVFNVGDNRNLSDEQNPGTLFYATGIWAALSTRPDFYVAPVAGNQAMFSVKFGQ